MSIEQQFVEAADQFDRSLDSEIQTASRHKRFRTFWEARKAHSNRLKAAIESAGREEAATASNAERKARERYDESKKAHRHSVRDREAVQQRLVDISIELLDSAGSDERVLLEAEWFWRFYDRCRWAKLQTPRHELWKKITPEIRRRFKKAAWLKDRTSCIATSSWMKQLGLKRSQRGRLKTGADAEAYKDDVASARTAYPALRRAITELKRLAKAAANMRNDVANRAAFDAWLIDDVPPAEPSWEDARWAKNLLRHYTRPPLAAQPLRPPGKKKKIPTSLEGVVRNLHSWEGLSPPPSKVARALLAEAFRVPVGEIRSGKQ